MRCDDEIRADGVAPVPVADAHPHFQQMRAEHPLPPPVSPGVAPNHPPKNAPGCGAGGPARMREREALTFNSSHESFPQSFDEQAIRQLIEFFELLDRWDREAHANEAM